MQSVSHVAVAVLPLAVGWAVPWNLPLVGLLLTYTVAGIVSTHRYNAKPRGEAEVRRWAWQLYVNLAALGLIYNAIFVNLGSRTGDAVTTKIMLAPGDFAVLDKNGTDGRASFRLPAPAGGTAYQVFARPLGTPGGMARITTCAEQVLVDGVYVEDEVCSTENEVFVREVGKNTSNKFENVTQSLTTIVIDDDVTDTYGETTAYAACGGTDTDGDDAPIRVDLFDSCLENYFWKYDNNGLRVLQLRFYPAS